MVVGLDRRWLMLMALLAALLLALAACGAPLDGAASGTATSAAIPRQTPAATSTPTAPKPAGPANLTQSNSAEQPATHLEPPRSTLSYAGQTQTGRTSSFTWTACEAGRCQAFHADAPGITIPPAEERLTVPAGAVLTFTFGGKTPPSILSVTAYVLDDHSPRPFGPGSPEPAWLQRWGQRTTDLSSRQTDLTLAITADPPAAEYVIVVDRRVRDDSAAVDNSAGYSFRVSVQ